MKQEAFIQKLREELRSLPKQAVDEIVADYHEYIGDARAAGRKEEDVIAALGDPVKLARELKAQASYRQWESRRSFGNLMRVVASIAGLGLLNAVLLLPFMLYLAVLTAGYAVSIAFTICGLVTVVGFGSHHLFGWPLFDSLPVVVMSGSHDGQHAGRRNSIVGDIHDVEPDTRDVRIENDRFELTPQEGSTISIVTSAGPIVVKKEDGKVDVVSVGPGAGRLLARDKDGTLSIRIDDVMALDGQDRDGDHLSLAHTGKDGKSTTWAVSSGDGDHLRYEEDEHGHPKGLALESGSDSVVINASGAFLNDGDERLHISAPVGSTLAGIAFGYAWAMLVGGIVGLLLCAWLTRITWRALVRYVHRQIDAISAGLDREQAV